MRDAVRIDRVAGRLDLQRFIRLPWRLYRQDPAWVPPLLFDLKKLLSPKKHPFHQHADVQYFLARLDGEVVGRIAAIVNHRHVQFHAEPVGFFGFFESIENQDVATALLTAAERWVAARGMQRIRGPMNFSTNEECGLLVDGFHDAPKIMMPHHLPYYGLQIETAGYGKAKDLFAYILDVRGKPPPERLVHGIKRLQQRQNIRLRPISKKRFDEEIRVLHGIYHRTWEKNWGFVPMSEAEVDLFASQLRLVVDPKLCLIAEHQNEPVGFALAIPDYNQALRHIDGRLFPFGLLKFLWYRRSINMARIPLLGVNPGFRRRGIEAMLYVKLWEVVPHNGYPVVECSWILEDNWDMRRGLEQMGAHVYKTYRVYEKEV